MAAYYNEIDPEKAAWIRELIRANVVAPGDVDERDIKLVQPDDLRGYRQCHFFAGIAVWSYALRLAGWPDDREVWTGSCPCPSFSAAGKGQGFDDARHLWPDWYGLIRECKPATVFGEQADDAIGYGWLDLVQAQMEAANYAVGKAVLASASVGGADLRERLYFVAHATSFRQQPSSPIARIDRAGIESSQSSTKPSTDRSISGSVADTQSERCGEARSSSGRPSERAGDGGEHGSLDDTANVRHERRGDSRRGWPRSENAGATSELVQPIGARLEGFTGNERDGNQSGRIRAEHAGPTTAAGILGGFWSNAEWIWCRDSKYRPVEPGTFPLAHGATNRVLKLRGYGDAINAEVAKAFIESYAGVNV
jgi:DNA (cytosine-5)-methyltransferase 1